MRKSKNRGRGKGQVGAVISRHAVKAGSDRRHPLLVSGEVRQVELQPDHISSDMCEEIGDLEDFTRSAEFQPCSTLLFRQSKI